MIKNKSAYDHIKSNNIKTAILVICFPLFFFSLILLFTALVQPFEEAFITTLQVAIPTMVVSLIWLLISWAFGDSMMLNAVNAKKIEKDKENKDIYNIVENVALAAGLPTPHIYIIEDKAMNAFATGRSPKDASIALTRGIINQLDTNELSGVIAHEMAHIGNRDIRLDMMIITGVGITVFAADMILRAMLYTPNTSNNDSRNNSALILFMIWLAFTIFNVFITPLLQLAISRKREFAADATGAVITRNPKALASALRKITTNSCIKDIQKNKNISIACIAESSKPHEFIGNLFATHPSTKERIKRLESM